MLMQFRNTQCRFMGFDDARQRGGAKGLTLSQATFSTVLDELFDAFVEPNLVQPNVHYGSPVEISPLAKRKKDDPC